jgi:hypothetical protein
MPALSSAAGKENGSCATAPQKALTRLAMRRAASRRASIRRNTGVLRPGKLASGRQCHGLGSKPTLAMTIGGTHAEAGRSICNAMASPCGGVFLLQSETARAERYCAFRGPQRRLTGPAQPLDSHQLLSPVILAASLARSTNTTPHFFRGAKWRRRHYFWKAFTKTQ